LLKFGKLLLRLSSTFSKLYTVYCLKTISFAVVASVSKQARGRWKYNSRRSWTHRYTDRNGKNTQ